MTSLMAFPSQVGEKGFSTVYNPSVQNPPEGREETENLCQHAEKAAACPEK